MYTKVVILEGKALQFEIRSQNFQNKLQYLSKPNDAFGFLATALPTNNDIRFDHVFHHHNILPGLDENWHDVCEIQQSDQKTKLDPFLYRHTLSWKPRPRAVRADSNQFFSNSYPTGNPVGSDTNLHKEIGCDGLVELGLMSSCFYSGPGEYAHYVSPDLLLVTFANLIAQTHRVRLHADRPTTPYTIKASMLVKESPKTVGSPGVRFGDTLGTFGPGITTFPLYGLNDVDDATNLLNLFRLDLYHTFGHNLDTDKFHLEIEDWTLDESAEREGE